MDIVTKKKLNILIQLAHADRDFASVERDLIFQIARERNYPEAEVEELIQHPEPIGSLGALSDRQKADYLMSSVELVMADHRVMESEILFTQNIAIKLGYLKQVVNHLIDNFDKRQDLRLSDFKQV
ncbi:MAG: hypothetical protein JNK10_14040 [Cyclobacteriaceae bacterium]|nr:hypothetical protein [Cyclobacteriaceae bacterium]